MAKSARPDEVPDPLLGILALLADFHVDQIRVSARRGPDVECPDFHIEHTGCFCRIQPLRQKLIVFEEIVESRIWERPAEMFSHRHTVL